MSHRRPELCALLQSMTATDGRLSQAEENRYFCSTGLIPTQSANPHFGQGTLALSATKAAHEP